MSFVSLSPDIIVIGVAILVVIYGLAFGHHRIKMFALSIYVGILLAQELGPLLYHLIAGSHSSLGSMFNLNNVEVALFVVPLIVFGLSPSPVKASAKKGMFMTFILSVLTAGLLISSALSLLGSAQLKQVLGQSFIALNIYQLRLWWIGLVPLAAILGMFSKHKASHHRD